MVCCCTILFEGRGCVILEKRGVFQVGALSLPDQHMGFLMSRVDFWCRIPKLARPIGQRADEAKGTAAWGHWFDWFDWFWGYQSQKLGLFPSSHHFRGDFDKGKIMRPSAFPAQKVRELQGKPRPLQGFGSGTCCGQHPAPGMLTLQILGYTASSRVRNGFCPW